MTTEQFNESVNKDIKAMMEQRTPEWYQARLGLLGCSRLADVLAQGKSGQPSATRKNYMMELLIERLTGERKESFTTPEMQRGVDLEADARAAYEFETGNTVVEHGGMMHPSIPGWWGSPDGLVGDHGMIEIKCPNTATHLDTFLHAKIDQRYMYQMAGYLEIFGRDWIDFVSYDDRLPDNLSLMICHITKSDLPIDAVRNGSILFLNDLNELERELRGRM